MLLTKQTVVNYLTQRNRAWLLTLIGVVCLVYLPFLGNAFFLDDLTFIALGSAREYVHGFFSFDLRWLSYATLDWTAQQFTDVVPDMFHLGNALLHIANVILLFFLLRRLMAAVISEQDQAVVARGAWFGALIFACHPVAVYAVGYVVQRSIVMATLFALATQLFYLRALSSGHKRWLGLAIVSYFLAIFSDEHSVMLPALLAAMTFLLRDKIKLSRRVLWLGLAAFFVTGMLLILRAQGVFGSPYATIAALMPEQSGVGEKSFSAQLMVMLTQMGLYFKYLLLWLLPNPAWMSVDMHIRAIDSWAAWQAWAGALGFVAYGAMAFGLLLRGQNRGLAGLALLYPWLMFLVEFVSSRSQDPFALYRSYLWLPGLMLLIPLLLQKFPGRRTLLALGLAVLLLVPLAWNRLWVFADSYRLWNDAALLLSADPAKGRNQDGMPEAGARRILFNRAMALVVAQKWPEAAAELKYVVDLYPNLPPARHALGMAYLNVDRFEEAIVQFDAGIRLDSAYAGNYYGKGLALLRMRKTEQVATLMRKACELGNEIPACLLSGLTNGKK